jgi:hypothetical protein
VGGCPGKAAAPSECAKLWLELDAFTSRMEDVSREGAHQARLAFAATSARLPIDAQLLSAADTLVRRARAVVPATGCADDVLHALIRQPNLDGRIKCLLRESGYLACMDCECDAPWQYDITRMTELARRDGGEPLIERHCRSVLCEERAVPRTDWKTMLVQFGILRRWFPGLTTLCLLDALCTRLSVLHSRRLLAAGQWLYRDRLQPAA